MTASLSRGVLMFGLAGCLGAALPAAAQVALSDFFRVYDPVTGNIVFQVSVTEAAEDPNTIYLINVPDLANPLQPPPTVVWEDFIGVGGKVSDVFGIVGESPGCGDGDEDLCLFFNSDGEGVPPLFGSFNPAFNNVLESSMTSVLVGGVAIPGFDATQYLNPEAGFTAVFWSDPVEGQQVPEPGSLALLGIGAAALGAFRRRANTQA